jgi:hypothetical protein
MDTEGFDSTGASDVYDDRIFALAALSATTMIYNLPETIKEGDIEKLSFAVELSKEFDNKLDGKADRKRDSLKGRDADRGLFELPHLIWLLQRDFLKGDVSEMVEQALRIVPNPDANPQTKHINDIRESIKVVGSNHSGFGLVQPHLDRASLCELHDDDFDQLYVKQRGQLQALVKGLQQGRTLGGQTMTGKALARHLSTIVTALNEREIPSARGITQGPPRYSLTACRTFPALFTACSPLIALLTACLPKFPSFQ